MADLDEIRAGVRARLAKTAANHAAAVPPRYDEVFAAGVKWLDGLAGDRMTDAKGRLEMSRDAWDSARERDSEPS